MWHCAITILTLIVSFTSSTMVDLSNRGLKKEDFFVRLQSQIDISEVTTLILQRNKFDSFLDCSTNLESLKILDLSQNHLQRFFFLCKSEYNLQVLNVSHNRLDYIDDKALNDRIPKLKVLDLSFNQLSTINETMLEHFKILEFLSLSSNPIYDGIHEYAFLNLTALKHLDLRNISAPYFPPDLFNALMNLSTLDLSWNPISTIPTLPIYLEELDLSGTQIVILNNLNLPNLRELRLNEMVNLTYLALNDFENLTSLKTLSVGGCKKLTQFTVWPHDGPLLPQLQRLSVQECALETLNPDLKMIMQRTAVINLQNNPWRCDCRMQWLNLMNSSKSINLGIRCLTPDQHHNKLLQQIPDYELQCEYVSTVFYPILWSCITILSVAVLLFGVLFVFRREIGQWSIRTRNRDTVSYTNVVESSNDLVRILPIPEMHERNEE